MNLRQLLVCCGLVLASLQLPAESAPTHSRLASATSPDANPLAALDSRISSSVNGSVSEGWMLRGISSLSCDACEAAVGIVQDLFEQGKDWDYLATIAGDICLALKIEDRNVCMSITQLFKVKRDRPATPCYSFAVTESVEHLHKMSTVCRLAVPCCLQ